MNTNVLKRLRAGSEIFWQIYGSNLVNVFGKPNLKIKIKIFRPRLPQAKKYYGLNNVKKLQYSCFVIQIAISTIKRQREMAHTLDTEN